MGAHLIDGEFQSDKYPSTPRGKVPLSVRDVTAQDLLWEYAQRRRAVDAEFADDLEAALSKAGYASGFAITPFKAPQAPKPEPEAVLKFGAIEVRLTLTYLHHLRNQQGWFSPHSSPEMCGADIIMENAVQRIERAMWEEIDREK